MPASAPFGTMFENPISQGSFEAYIVAGFLRLDPLVLQDFLSFSLEFTVEGGIFQQIITVGGIHRNVRHSS
jgi:hypothetical protein